MGNILVALENDFPTQYREYYEVKRNNLFAAITKFPSLWSCFMRLDSIFMQEFEDLKVVTDPNRWLPLALFMHLHAQFRIFLELGFAGAFCEAYNVARMAIESAYQACKIIENPDLIKTWARKEEDQASFDESFNAYKKQGYANLGLEKLHKHFSDFSSWSHPSISSLNFRFKRDAVDYLETDEQRVGLGLGQLLFASDKLEKALFYCFNDRLKLDHELEKKRLAFEEKAEQTRVEVIKRFDLKPPR